MTGGTIFSATDPATYGAMANAGDDFIWTEMQHGGVAAELGPLANTQGQGRGRTVGGAAKPRKAMPMMR